MPKSSQAASSSSLLLRLAHVLQSPRNNGDGLKACRRIRLSEYEGSIEGCAFSAYFAARLDLHHSSFVRLKGWANRGHLVEKVGLPPIILQ